MKRKLLSLIFSLGIYVEFFYVQKVIATQEALVNLKGAGSSSVLGSVEKKLENTSSSINKGYPKEIAPPYLPNNSTNNKPFSEIKPIIDRRNTLHKAQFIGGGKAGTIFGFGIGHAIQDRYLPLGLVFTLTELMAIGGATFTCLPFVNRLFTTQRVRWKKRAPFCALSLLVLYGFKAWEIYDVWSLPSSYKLISRTWQIAPTYSYNDFTESNDLGIAFKWNW